jgi:hypothetical protein
MQMFDAYKPPFSLSNTSAFHPTLRVQCTGCARLFQFPHIPFILFSYKLWYADI